MKQLECIFTLSFIMQLKAISVFEPIFTSLPILFEFLINVLWPIKLLLPIVLS